MKHELARRTNRIKPSPTLAVTQKATELRARGVQVISFSAGEPDFDTPAHIIEAAKQALDAGATRYTPVAGIMELRKKVAELSGEIRGVPCAAENVIVSVGAKHSLFGAIQALVDEGDEVIVPAPFWVSYPDQVLLSDGKPVIVQTAAEDGWVLTPQKLEAAITERTRAVVINSPSNPTGSIYSAEQLKAVVQLAVDRGLYVISDEIYRDLIYGGDSHVSALSVVAESQRDRVIVVDGVSKTFAMTGWRIGWAIAHPEIVKAIAKMQSQSTSNPTTVAQKAALAAIEGPMDFLEGWKTQYVARRNKMVELLSGIDGVSCDRPAGAFYVLPNVSGVVARMGAQATDVELATYLLEEAEVATVPGSAFGAPGHLRLSYATSLEQIEAGLAQMKSAIERL